jgi:hypothetical protein
MGLASYEIVGDAREWQNVYETKEAAFAASLALRQGHEVRITAPGRDTATGAADTG